MRGPGHETKLLLLVKLCLWSVKSHLNCHYSQVDSDPKSKKQHILASEIYNIYNHGGESDEIAIAVANGLNETSSNSGQDYLNIFS